MDNAEPKARAAGRPERYPAKLKVSLTAEALNELRWRARLGASVSAQIRQAVDAYLQASKRNA